MNLKLSESMKGNKNRLGFKTSDKTKRKMARSMKRVHKQRRLDAASNRPGRIEE